MIIDKLCAQKRYCTGQKKHKYSTTFKAGKKYGKYSCKFNLKNKY